MREINNQYNSIDHREIMFSENKKAYILFRIRNLTIEDLTNIPVSSDVSFRETTREEDELFQKKVKYSELEGYQKCPVLELTLDHGKITTLDDKEYDFEKEKAIADVYDSYAHRITFALQSYFLGWAYLQPFVEYIIAVNFSKEIIFLNWKQTGDTTFFDKRSHRRVKKKNVEKFIKHLRDVIEKISKHCQLQTAVERYNFMKHGHHDHRIIDGVIALEALLNSYSDTSSMKHKTSLRAALLHKSDRMETYKFVGAMYDLRSSISHGSSDKQQKIAKIKKEYPNYQSKLSSLVRDLILVSVTLDWSDDEFEKLIVMKSLALSK